MLNQKMQLMFEEGDFKTLIQHIDTLESPNLELQIEGLIYKSRMMAMMDEWKAGLNYADQAIDLSRNHQLELFEILSLIAKAYSCDRSHHAMLDSTISQLEITITNIRTSIPDNTMARIRGDLHFLKGWYQFNDGRVESSQQELDKSFAIRRSEENRYGLIEVLLHLSFTHLEATGTPELSLKYGEEGLKFAEELGNKHLLGLAYNWYGSAVAFHKDAHEGLDIIEKGIKIYKQLGKNGEGKLSRIYNNIAVTYRNLEDYDKTLEYQRLYQTLAEKENDLSSLGYAHSNLSVTFVNLNDFDKAIQHRKKSLEIAYQINNKSLISTYHLFLGAIYYLKGDLNLAEKEALLVEQQISELDNFTLLVWARIRLLFIYTLKMQTEKAFVKINEILTSLDNVQDHHVKGWTYINAGINYKTVGDLNQARDSFEKAGEYWDKIPDAGTVDRKFRLSFLLFQKILLMQELGENSKAEEYYNELELVSSDTKSKWIILRARFIEGLILKSKTRGSSKFHAQSIFQEIIESKLIDIQIYSLAMLNLCDLLILEMKITEDPEIILKEILNLVNKMTDMGKTQDIPMLLVMGELIHGKIDLVYNDLESARHSFQRAKNVAEEYNLSNLISKVQIEQDFVDIQLSKWRDQQIADLSLPEKVEKAQIREYLTHAISVKEKMVNSGAISN